MIDRNVKAFALRALLASGGPCPEDALKTTLRRGFTPTVFTDGDLTQWLRELETLGLIAGTTDELIGTVWLLTPKGKIRAQQL